MSFIDLVNSIEGPKLWDHRSFKNDLNLLLEGNLMGSSQGLYILFQGEDNKGYIYLVLDFKNEIKLTKTYCIIILRV